MDSCGHGRGGIDLARGCRTERACEQKPQDHAKQRERVPPQARGNYPREIQQVREELFQKEIEAREGAGRADAGAHQRDSNCFGKARRICRRTQREVGRIHQRGHEEVSGHARVDSHGQIRCLNTTEIGPGFGDRRSRDSHASAERHGESPALSKRAARGNQERKPAGISCRFGKHSRQVFPSSRGLQKRRWNGLEICVGEEAARTLFYEDVEQPTEKPTDVLLL